MSHALIQYLASLFITPAIGGAVLAIFWAGRKLVEAVRHAV
ncbi:hypothetical protein [Bradyrhizobium barranii]|nr:hypothetical protein [Bradyrhizobium barranii]